MFAVVARPWSDHPEIVKGPYETLGDLFKGVRRYIAGPSDEFCELVDGRWLVIDVISATAH